MDLEWWGKLKCFHSPFFFFNFWNLILWLFSKYNYLFPQYYCLFILVLGTSQLNLVFPRWDSTSFPFQPRCSSALFQLAIPLLLLHLFFLYMAMLCGMQGLSSPTGGQTHASCSESVESWPLDCQGIPIIHLIFALILLSDFSGSIQRLLNNIAEII